MNWRKDEGVDNLQYKYNFVLNCIYLFIYNSVGQIA